MANSGFVVTAAALIKLAGELLELNSQYKQRVENLAQQETELRSMWEGEANQAFQRAFANDKVNLDNFYAVIARYIEALQQAAQEYQRAEQQATQIASTRTY